MDVLSPVLSGVLLVVLGGVLGFGLGRGLRASARERLSQVSANVTLAAVAITADLTYGQEWREDFINEVRNVMSTETDAVIAMATAMTLHQTETDAIGRAVRWS